MGDLNEEEAWTLTTERIAQVLADVRKTSCPRSAHCPDDVSRVQFALHIIAEKALGELLDRRAAQSASAERVRSVVREAVMALLDERKLYIVKPQQPTMNDIVLEAYGHGKACDAVALQGDDLQPVLVDLADRVASQLGPVGLSADERVTLQQMRESRYLSADEAVLLDRLLGAP